MIKKRTKKAILKPIYLIIPVFFLVACIGQVGTSVVPVPTTEIKTFTPDIQKDSHLEEIPSSMIYAVTGIPQGEKVNLYKEPNISSEIIGFIPSHGTGLQPISNINIIDEIKYLKVNYHDLSGWVEYKNLAEQHGSLSEDLVKLGQYVLTMLRTQDYGNIKDLIHPELCLRFSPYPYLNTDNQIMCGIDFENRSTADEILYWGQYDGKGDEINLSFQAYYEKFIYDQDYLKAPIIGFNQEVSSGNSINNIPTVYPDGVMIEYHFPGFDPQYGGMDWRSIRLVFVQLDSKWYLTAIIHGEWTI